MFKESNSVKVILLGEAGCGKTNLINACCNIAFNPQSASNLTSSFSEKFVTINKTKYCLKLWDTAGQEKFRSLNNLFIKDSNICILVYDITRKETFEELDYWKKTVTDILGDKALIAVAGNKIDLFEKEQVTEDEGEEYAKKIGAKFKLTSAKKNGKEFEKFVESLLKTFLEDNKYNQWEFVARTNEPERLSIEKSIKPKKKKGFC